MARAGTQNQKRFFHQFWDLLQGAQDGSRCSGSSVSLGRPVAKSVVFGSLLERFWEPHSQLDSLWGLAWPGELTRGPKAESMYPDGDKLTGPGPY